MKRDGPFSPDARHVFLAHRVARETQRSENQGVLVPRGAGEIWGFFRKRRSVVWYHEGEPVAHAAVTHIFDGPTEEVGAVMSWGRRRNGFAGKATRWLVGERRAKSPDATIIAMVDANNTASLGLFGNKLGGKRMRKQDVPSAAYAEQIPGSQAEEVVFDITHIND